MPSIEIRTPDRRNQSIQANDMNCLPWSVFMVSDSPNLAIALFNASTQKSASSVFEMRQANTVRVCQSIIATRYRNLRLIGRQMMSTAQT